MVQGVQDVHCNGISSKRLRKRIQLNAMIDHKGLPIPIHLDVLVYIVH